MQAGCFLVFANVAQQFEFGVLCKGGGELQEAFLLHCVSKSFHIIFTAFSSGKLKLEVFWEFSLVA